MKVLLVLASPDLYPSAEPIVLELCGRGHEVKVSYRAKSGDNLENERILDEMFEPAARFDLFEHDPKVHRREDRWRDRIEAAKEWVDRTFYLRRQYPRPKLAERRQRKSPSSSLRRAAALTILSTGPAWRLLRRLETAFPPDQEILRRLDWDDPDLLLTFPFAGDRDVEYARAARALGIPNVGLLDDWSDLTSAAALHVLPDSLLVWSESLAAEGRSAHAIPARRLEVTGAAKLDPWFELSPSRGQDALPERAGLDPERPFALYFGANGKLSGETKSVHRLAEGLERRGVQLLVWPGAEREGIWRGDGPPNVTVLPAPSALETPLVRQQRFDAIYHAAVVVAAEPVGLLEAAVVGRPGLAVAEPRQAALEERLSHLRRLAGGDFFKLSGDPAEAAEAVADLVEGDDPQAPGRAALLETLIRPQGVERASAAAAADAIERLANGRSLRRRLRRGASSLRGRRQQPGPAEHRPDPVLIGANGGSGTRVFCRIAARGGIWMGAAVDDQEDSIALSRFYSRHAHPHLRNDKPDSARPDTVAEALHTAVRNHLAGIRDPGQRWGAKNPRSMLMLDAWHERYPDLKFLHVLRSGLDMAYSVNHNQLRRYGPLVLSREEQLLPELQRAILFWERTNGRAADYGESRLGERYLRVRLEDLCAEPATEIRRVFDFFEAGTAPDVEAAVELVQTPPTLGRWRSQPPEEVAGVALAGAGGLRRFGYWDAYVEEAGEPTRSGGLLPAR